MYRKYNGRAEGPFLEWQLGSFARFPRRARDAGFLIVVAWLRESSWKLAMALCGHFRQDRVIYISTLLLALLYSEQFQSRDKDKGLIYRVWSKRVEDTIIGKVNSAVT